MTMGFIDINNGLSNAKNNAEMILQKISNNRQNINQMISKAAQSFGGGQAQSQLATSLYDVDKALDESINLLSELKNRIENCQRKLTK